MRKKRNLVLPLIFFLLSALVVFSLKNTHSLAIANNLFYDSFDNPNITGNWPELGKFGNGQVSAQWASQSFDGIGGSINVQGISDGTPLPNMSQPVANVIAVHPIYEYLTDGVYEISGSFMTQNLDTLGAYQLLIMFEHNGWTYQATFHFRIADWSQMAPPNNNPSGIYVYDYYDNPIKVGEISGPYYSGQWMQMKGIFDTSKMEYISIELNGQIYNASGIRLVRNPNNLYPANDGKGTRHGQIHLSTAGTIGSLEVSGYYDVISFSFDNIVPTPTPTPTPTPLPTPTPPQGPTPTPIPVTPTPTKVPTPTPTGNLTPTPTTTDWRKYLRSTPTPTPTGNLSPTPTPKASPTPTSAWSQWKRK